MISYFEWLVRKIDSDEYHCDDYSELLYTLYSTDFIAIKDGDYNRVADGLGLRQSFAFETGIDTCEDEYIPLDCSCLEMLVAFSIRIEESIMWNPDKGNRTSKWFWMMVKNLGLTSYTDEAWGPGVDYILSQWIERKYPKNGSRYNILFTNNPEINLRKMEIWYQMNQFVIEFLDEN